MLLTILSLDIRVNDVRVEVDFDLRVQQPRKTEDAQTQILRVQGALVQLQRSRVGIVCGKLAGGQLRGENVVLEHGGHDGLDNLPLALLVIIVSVQQVVVDKALDDREQLGFVADRREVCRESVEKRVDLGTIKVESELLGAVLVVLRRLEALVGDGKEGNAMTQSDDLIETDVIG